MRLEDRFRSFRNAPAPDLWPDIEGRAPGARQPRAPRWIAAAAALAVAAAGLFLAARAFRTDRPPSRPASTPPEPVVVGTTEIPGANAVAVGEGSVWVGAIANDGGCSGTIHRIDPTTGEIVASIPVDAIGHWEVGGGGIDVQPGAVWVAGDVCGPGGDRVILQRIDPSTNEKTMVADLGAGLIGDVDATADSVWVTAFRNQADAELLRVDPGTGNIEATIPMSSQYVRGVLGAGGAVWVHPREVEASTVGSGYLVKVDPETNQIAETLDVKMEPPAFRDGSLWAHHGDAILEIDPATAAIVDRYPGVGVSQYGVLRSGAGGLWFLLADDTSGEGGAPVVRFSPETGQVDVVVDLGPDRIPVDMAVTDSSIWVVNYEGSLTRVDLRRP
jgi:hypothetical protein